MKKLVFLLTLVLLISLAAGCSKDNVDEIKMELTMSSAEGRLIRTELS